MSDEEQVKKLSTADRCSVIAPAGCGKTELIIKAIKLATKPRVLVLTHTNAGVSVLRQRIAKNKISQDSAQVDTIARWCLRYARAYPKMSELKHRNPKGKEWDAIYDNTETLLKSKTIRSVVEASYDAVYVDEYQDCAMKQHKVVMALAELLPCRVLGDPLQGIFGFAGANLSWKQDVEAVFNQAIELKTPWRWKDKNPELGQWLIELRNKLIQGEAINLKESPISHLQETIKNKKQLMDKMLKTEDKVVVVFKWGENAHEFASEADGFFSMEEKECKRLMDFSNFLDDATNTELTFAGIDNELRETNKGFKIIKYIIGLANDCMKINDNGLNNFIENIKNNFNTIDHYHKRCSGIEKAVLTIIAKPDASSILLAMEAIEKNQNTKVFRKELWSEAKRTIRQVENKDFLCYLDAAYHLRHELRNTNKALDSKLVSRTLLIKGLEFDHSVIVDPLQFMTRKPPIGDGAKNFYVAATRGSKTLSILSNSSEIQFAPIAQLMI